MAKGLPPTASVVRPDTGAKLHAPAAARNSDALSGFLQKHVPLEGRALELASGTGQHVARFAADIPGLEWHPTEVETARLRSIDAYVAESGLRNVAPARHLDAVAEGWAEEVGRFDVILLINLLHLISDAEARTLINEAAKAAQIGGLVLFYGPFRREGALTSEGDQRFDAQLRAADPAIGYKDSLDMMGWLGDAGLIEVTSHEMPANNLAFVARKPEE